MKSKKLLAQIAAFSLLFGMTGVVSSWADEIYIDGQTAYIYDPVTGANLSDSATWLTKNEDGSFTVSNRDVKGAYNNNHSTLIANNVNFIDGGYHFAEVGPSYYSTFIMNGGSIQTTDMRFSADSGSTAIINHAKVTTGAWSNNSVVTLKDCTTSGSVLYAGNAYPEEKEDGTLDNADVAAGLHEGQMTIDGGTAHVNNVLVQNKGLFTVTNGAVLDLTGDTSAWDKESVEASGITNRGNLTVRAWGPSTATAERSNNDYINQLDQASTFSVTGKSTVKTDTLMVAGNIYDGHIDTALLQVKDGSIEANQATFGQYSSGNFDQAKLAVNGNLTIQGNGVYDADGKWTSSDVYGNVTVNDSQVNVAGHVTIDGGNLSIKGSTIKTGSEEVMLTTEEDTDTASLTAKDITLKNKGMFSTDDKAVVNADTITVNEGTVLSAGGHSTLNVNQLRVSDKAKRVRVRGNFNGRVTDVNGNAMDKGAVRDLFRLNPEDKTSYEFYDPEVDHTLVLHMNTNGALTMQGKDFSQADTGNTRTYVMASWSANGDYNAEGHDIKNVNSLSANRLVINGTDITDSLGGVVDVSGKADTSLGNLTDEGKKVIRNTMKGDLDTKADATTVKEELAKKADAEAMTTALSQKAQASDLAQLQKGANIDKAAWQSSLGDGKNVAGNTGLITGDTLYQALQGISTTGTVYKAGKHITIDKDNTIMVNTDGKVAAGDTGIVTGGQVQEAISKATEGIATNVANKADKNLSNLSDAGKTVIKNTMMEELAGKADTNLTNLSDAGKEAIKNTVKADLMGKADTSYVDEKVKDKVNTSDFTAIKDKVDAHETALADKADKSYVDAAVKKATEGVATDANVANKADKDLGNLSEAGKNVIKETMKDDLAVKADKTYVDDQLKNKVDTADFNKVKEQVDSNEKALATKADKKDLSDLSAKVDGKADKTYVDGALDKKANAADVYTKTDTDKKIEDSLTDVNKAVDGKADKADVEKLGQKVDQNVSELNANKADAKASNIDVAAYTNKLNTGKVEDGNKGLVSGGAVWSAINEVKNNTGAGLVTVKGDTVTIASDADATKVSVAGKNGDRVLTGVKTDEKDASSAANVGYVNSTAISLTDSMNAMNSKLSDDIKNAGAVGAALAGLHHLDYDPDNKLDVAVAAGNYRGKSATAMGLFYQPNEMMMVSAGATIGADDNAYNVGLSFKVGKGQTGLTTSKAAMSQEIKELKAAKKESDQKMAAQDEEIRALKEQVAMLVKEMKLSNTVEKDMKK